MHGLGLLGLLDDTRRDHVVLGCRLALPLIPHISASAPIVPRGCSAQSTAPLALHLQQHISHAHRSARSRNVQLFSTCCRCASAAAASSASAMRSAAPSVSSVLRPASAVLASGGASPPAAAAAPGPCRRCCGPAGSWRRAEQCSVHDACRGSRYQGTRLSSLPF
jgi:hypothetical protein